MTIEEKAKAYDEALERAKKIHTQTEFDYEKGMMEEIFPELKESEDEKIRKEIIRFIQMEIGIEDEIVGNKWIAWLGKQGDKDKLIKELGEYKVKYTQEVLEKHLNSMNNKESDRLRKTTIAFLKEFADKGYENAVECIEWLEKQDKNESDPRYKCLEDLLTADDIYQMSMNEVMVEEARTKAINALSELEISKLLGLEKQGEKPQGKSALEAIKEEEVDSRNFVRSADRIKPKFKVGDWITNRGHSYLIANIDYENDRYLFEIGGYTHEPLNWEYIENVDRNYHLWTIKDAKDGDILCAKGSYFKEYVFKFSSFTEDNVISTHFGYDVFHGTFDTKLSRFGREEDFVSITPATKEQRDLLFSKMHEADYEWDTKKRTLERFIQA